MSASSKKKLRNEQNAAKLTERQIAEQKEAKQVKLYTIAFVVVLAILLVIAVTVGVNQTIANSGIREKNTVALTVGDNEISNAEMNYFFVDTVNNFYSTNGYYLSLMGLDTSIPMDQQVYNEETGETWADYFLHSAADAAHSVYAMADAAKAAGHTLTEDDTAEVEAIISNMTLYSTLYGYPDIDSYLEAAYGKGSTEESYRAYVENSMLADSFYNTTAAGLTYDDAALREAEADNYAAFSSFTYDFYYLSASRFLEGGTTDEEGNTTYSDEEKAAAAAAAKEAAMTLAESGATTTDELNEAISNLDVNADITAQCTSNIDVGYSSINSMLSDWISDDARVAGDMTWVENASTTTAEDGTESTTVNGYYVALFHGSNDNNFALKNARHILVSFEGGTTDGNGVTTYSDEENAAAKTKAEEILQQWKDGEATEESFGALATEKTTDSGSIETGGLYENIYPKQMVAPFEDWCYDASRVAGDTGIVETEYGYHVMYFVGDSQFTFRDFQIHNKLASEHMSAWYAELLENTTVVEGNTEYINKSLVMSNG